MAVFLRSSSQLRRNVAAAMRNYSSKGPSSSNGHKASMLLWQRLTYFVAIPCLALCSLNAYLGEMEHFKHFHRPEFHPYEYMRIRTKPFPWGDGNHSLLHNKYIALPDGYEDDDEHEEK